mmetsp:Transcript_8307/g.13146  ORF Transcript_8307/g.13146 Transcript_8307/m.13146 type:complete len:492 (+) Transcript_8307:196-1671(+)
MRFAIAAAVLTKTLPVSSESSFSSFLSSKSSSNKLNDNVEQIQAFLEQRRESSSSLQGQTPIPKGGKLKNILSKKLKENFEQECDPKAVVKAEDVGILSCGEGHYCMESTESSLGGFCVSDQPEASRMLQANTTLIEDIYQICTGNTSFFGCECDGIDVKSYSGSISCAYEQFCVQVPNVCGENVTFCYDQSYRLTLSDVQTGTAEQCYSFSEPEQFSYCYQLTYPEGGAPAFCEIKVNDVTCDSCQPANGTCSTFDCTNTDLGVSGTFCDYTIPEYQISNTLLYNALPCANGCNLCGDGNYIIDRYANLTLPESNFTYECNILELAALAGYFENADGDLCNELPPLVKDTCGCDGQDMTAETTAPEANETAAPEIPEPSEAPFICNICGDGNEVTSGDATVETPENGSFTCNQLVDLGMNGMIKDVECSLLQPAVQDPCGCSPKKSSDAPAPAPGINEINSATVVVSTKQAMTLIGITTMAVLTNFVMSA